MAAGLVDQGVAPELEIRRPRTQRIDCRGDVEIAHVNVSRCSAAAARPRLLGCPQSAKQRPIAQVAPAGK
jgi:hypothetical protein